MHENKATTERREPKDLNSCSKNESDQLNNSGQGVCEYMGAAHSSQHTAPDAEHISTFCCPTHEMWELPTLLIVTNRSQQGDEVYGSYPLVLKTSIMVRTDQDNKDLNTYPTSYLNNRSKSDAYANRLQKGDVFAYLFKLGASFHKLYQMKSLSKRSPVLPHLLQSELPTAGNR
ncbi:heat shock protein 83 [Dorcoceras hygrometricum]|uniref:Heat shock protein 83 n=1 Tax=Dorcoceras hygrometricum TaxID=472368 RepID=A0A2Z7BJS0_9LAMI|nr:heat shock protein 83 [Dorcoceras hygrometricum]